MHAHPLNTLTYILSNGRAGIHIMIGNTKFAGTGAVSQCPEGKIHHPSGERHKELLKKEKILDALKYAIENGTWEDLESDPLYIALSNIEYEVNK